MSPRVVLIGLPGTGKSVVGANVAGRLRVQFQDSDHLITAQAGRSVTEIFAAEGEEAFRTLESTVVIAALAGFDGVLSLGGGAVTTPAVREALADSDSPVVLLTAQLSELVRRVGGRGGRPLLADDPAARLETLSRQREVTYRSVCTLSVDTSGRSVADVSAGIIALLGEPTVHAARS